MPKIVINEHDNTTTGIREYSNFTVVVPGLIGAASGIDTSVFNEDGIYECDNQADFVKHVGKAKAQDSQIGNQIAYELLGLGYKVIYKKIDLTAAESEGAVTVATVLAKSTFWEPLKDKATYDFRYVITGLTKGNANANNEISKLCKDRGDAIALLDIDTTAYLDNTTPKTQAEAIKGIIAETAQLSSADKFSAIFAPAVTYEGTGDAEYGNNRTFPATFHYLACAAESQATYPEWFAVAGYTRGRCNAFKIAETTVTLGEAAINALEPRTQKTHDTLTVKTAVNIIAKIKGNYYLWGDRTAHPLGAEANSDLVASHFLNIRQLCTTIKKQLYINCRRFTFEPNSDVLWVNFCNAIEPTLDKMKANQGISDYQIIKKRNPKKAVLSAIIRIVPIEAVEDFEIDLTLEDSIEGDIIAIND